MAGEVAQRRACDRAKTAIAEEVGNIQGISERFIAESDEYVMRRIPQGKFDHKAGERPRTVRYSSAPVADSGYRKLLTEGHEMEVDATRGAGGDKVGMEAKFDKRGAAGCDLPGDTITGGYDEFYRELVGKAWETEPTCAMELVLKKHVDEYIHMLHNDLPMRAKEQFGYDLERRVIEFGFYNVSCVGNEITGKGYFNHQRGYFPAEPNGGLDLGLVRNWFRVLRRQGWTGAAEVGPISESAFNAMRRSYKDNENMEVKTVIDGDETQFLEHGTTKKIWGGICWVISDTPTRGYLRDLVLPSGTVKEFVPVRPTVARRGTGEGLVAEVNEDYDRCSTVVDGTRYELFEVAYAIHPTACERQAFQPSQIAGKKWSKNLFNFEVRFLDKWQIPCNVDEFKFMIRLLHAYAFSAENPERMGAIIYRVSPDCIYLNPVCCDEDDFEEDPVYRQDPDTLDGSCDDCGDHVDPDTLLDEEESIIEGKDPFHDLEDPDFTAKSGDGAEPETGHGGGQWQLDSGVNPYDPTV